MLKLLGRIAALWAVAGGCLLLAIVAVTTTNVAAFLGDRIARPFGGAVAGLPGYEEFVQLAIGGAALMCFPWCQYRQGHVAAELFSERLGPATRRALDRAWFGLTAATALFLAVTMASGMAEGRADGTVTPVLGWPEWPFLAPGIVSLVLWALVALGQALSREAGARG